MHNSMNIITQDIDSENDNLHSQINIKQEKEDIIFTDEDLNCEN